MKICLNCKGTIPKGRVKHTCSDECAEEHSINMAMKKKEYDKQYYLEHKEERKVICDICQIEFTTKTSRKYCSDDCSADGKRIRQTERARIVRANNKAIDEDDIFIPEKFLVR